MLSSEETNIIKSKLIKRYKSRPSLELNFIMSHTETMASFVELDKPFTSMFAVTDMNFNLLFLYQVNSYIAACGISDNGNVAAFLTANSNTTDGNSLFLVNVESKSLIYRADLLKHVKYVGKVFVDTDKEVVFIRYDDITVQYNFSGELISDTKFANQYLSSATTNPYELIAIVTKITETLFTTFDNEMEEQALRALRAARRFPDMSKYQLSLAYKSLGDCYFEHSMNEKALAMYKEGLDLNPRLTVKRKIKKLENEH